MIHLPEIHGGLFPPELASRPISKISNTRVCFVTIERTGEGEKYNQSRCNLDEK